MNVNLAWQTSILCIAVVDDRIVANNYSLCIDFITNTVDSRHQNIAFERMKFMLSKIFDQSIFISATNKLLPKIADLSPTNLVILPEEGYDQVINLALYCKLNSIMEGKLLVEAMSISSTVNNDITYSFGEDDNLGPFAVHHRKKAKPWWLRPDLRTTDAEEGHFPIDGWADIGLSFEQLAPSRPNVKGKKKVDNTVKASYNKPNTPQIIGFNPEVIAGGKTTDAD